MNQPLEVFQEGFNQLIDKLGGINTHLDRQISQQQDVMAKIEQLPNLLQNFPQSLQNQKAVTDELFGQLKTAAARNQQFAETVEKIPSQTARQTDTLINMTNQLSAAADVDVQMNENFNKFNTLLEKLHYSVEGQTDSIIQMSRTFSASDRRLKYMLSKQSRRFTWLFVSSLTVCCIAVIALLIVFLIIF